MAIVEEWPLMEVPLYHQFSTQILTAANSTHLISKELLGFQLWTQSRHVQVAIKFYFALQECEQAVKGSPC